MKDFFKLQLDSLILAGIRQLEFMTKEQVQELVGQLCILSEKKFGYIPQHIQQNEIRKQILEDAEFNGLNTRWLFKVLSRMAPKYWNEKYKEPDPEPFELSEEEKKGIDLLAEQVKRTLFGNFTPSISGIKEEMERIKIEDEQQTEKPKAFSPGYVSTLTPEEHELKLQWIRENFDPLTGKPLAVHKSFDLWKSETLTK